MTKIRYKPDQAMPIPHEFGGDETSKARRGTIEHRIAQGKKMLFWYCMDDEAHQGGVGVIYSFPEESTTRHIDEEGVRLSREINCLSRSSVNMVVRLGLNDDIPHSASEDSEFQQAVDGRYRIQVLGRLNQQEQWTPVSDSPTLWQDTQGGVSASVNFNNDFANSASTVETAQYRIICIPNKTG